MDDWASAIEAWLVVLGVAHRPLTTIGLRRYQLGRIAAELAPLGPWDVTADDLLGWLDGRSWSREYRRSWRSALRGFYGWAHGSGRIAVDPSLALPSIKPSSPNPRPTPEDVLRLAHARSDERVQLMLTLAGDYGMRRGEVCQVHARDLEPDLAGWTLIVHGKGGKTRRLPLSDAVAARVRRATAEGYAFPGAVDGHLSPAWVGKLVSREMTGAWTMHTLRHRCASVGFEVSRDIVAVQEALGHSSLETTRRYVKRPNEAVRSMLAAVAAF